MILEGVIGVIMWRVTLQGFRRGLETSQAKLSNTGIDLLVHLGKGSEVIATLLQCWRQGRALKVFNEYTPIMTIVVFQTQQRQYRRADIGVIRPGSAVDAYLIYTRPDHAKPGGSDLRLHITMIPGKARLFPDTRGIAVGCTAKKEVIGVGEHRQRGCTRRVGCN